RGPAAFRRRHALGRDCAHPADPGHHLPRPRQERLALQQQGRRLGVSGVLGGGPRCAGAARRRNRRARSHGRIELVEKFLAEHVLATVFAAVLVHQLGIPIPAFPVLIWAGAVAFGDPPLLAQAFVVSTLAGAAGNVPWYLAGRRYGYRVLKLLCRISLSPDSCVRQTEVVFERRGPAMLVVARFLPGFETVAPPLAGGQRAALGRRPRARDRVPPRDRLAPRPARGAWHERDAGRRRSPAWLRRVSP